MSDAAIVLSLNVGSSSLKLGVWEVAPDGNEPSGHVERRLASGAVEQIGTDAAHAWLRDEGGTPVHQSAGELRDHAAAVAVAFGALASSALPRPQAVGHRVVHGGADHWLPERIDARLLDTLRTLVPFAPLHLPHEIATIEAAMAHAPGVVQVVCFDTAFHHGMPERAQRLPLPRATWQQGIRRYGFHGLSYEYVVSRLGGDRLGRAVIAHLGNGASLAAVRGGEPVDTTMGFTPTGGVMMGTRTGDLDPGVLIHLLAHRGYDARALERLVNFESGLLGVSGSTSDMRALLEAQPRDGDAAQAVDMFCYQVRKSIGAFAAALGGLDTLVFTGGIGERAAPVRREICRGLEHLGVHIDVERNRTSAEVISPAASACTVRVLPTDEERMIARHTHAVAFAGRSPGADVA